jgi:2-polyprenyl-3-methyl-5-hydroxy-6-metoxy-1,4-benzoquinol methylase
MANQEFFYGKQGSMKIKSLMIKVFGLQHPHDRVVELFARYGDHGKLLDAPAGPGVISQKLGEAGFDVAAVDINPHLFCVQGISCEKADLNQDLPFSDGTFDYVLCSNGIEHLENPVLFIRESFRILKERGKFLISTPNILNLKSRLANLLVGFNLFTGRPNNEVDDYLGGDHIHLANYYELRTHLHRNGFRILEVTTDCYSNRAMLFAPLYPIVYFATRWALRREKNLKQRERNGEILSHVLSTDLILGKKLFLMAEKDPHYVKGKECKDEMDK